MKTAMFKCEVCGKTSELEAGKRHECDCNPSAPFYMWNVKHSKAVNKLVKGFMGGLRKK